MARISKRRDEEDNALLLSHMLDISCELKRISRKLLTIKCICLRHSCPETAAMYAQMRAEMQSRSAEMNILIDASVPASILKQIHELKTPNNNDNPRNKN